MNLNKIIPGFLNAYYFLVYPLQTLMATIIVLNLNGLSPTDYSIIGLTMLASILHYFRKFSTGEASK